MTLFSGVTVLPVSAFLVMEKELSLPPKPVLPTFTRFKPAVGLQPADGRFLRTFQL